MTVHTLVEFGLLGLAIIALLGVMFEEVIHINKAKTTLFVGTISWIVLFVVAPEGERGEVEHLLLENLTDIASLWLFLVSAMTFVAYLNKKGLIENLIYIVLPKRIGERKLLFLVALFCFVFSSLADNITATLVSITLVLSLDLPVKKTLRFATLVVFAVNSGGVALITGDVTTLMIFLADKVTINDLLLLSLPSFVAVMFMAALLSRGMTGEVIIRRKYKAARQVDVLIAITFVSTIFLTIIGNVLFRVPPVLSFLAGMSLMFLIAQFYGEDDKDPIMDYIRYISFDTLLFFLGILMIVGMLKHIGVLDAFVSLYAHLPSEAANYLMGIISSIVDNVPLTAAILKADIQMSLAGWLGLTYAVGVGGSLLVIGSAAGIVVMEKVEALTFGNYARYSLLLLLAYTLGYALVYYLSLSLSFLHQM